MEEEQFDLSIIIPYHNEEFKLVREALDSITAQKSAVRYEVILVDDGSSRDNSDRVRQYVENLSAARFYSQESKGVSAARNRGIREARGTYITFLDADDRYSLVFFSDLERILPLEPDLILGGTKIVSTMERFESRLSGDFKYYDKEEDLRVWKPRLYGKQYYFSNSEKVYLNVGIAAKAVKASIAKRHLVNERVHIAEDCLWNQQLFSEIESLVVVERLWYLYTKNALSATHRYNPEIIEWTRESLTAASEVLDLDNEDEERAYVDRMVILLKYISSLFLNHPDNKMSFRKRIEAENRIYTEKPWNYLLKYKKKNSFFRKTILLFRLRLLFEYWRLKYHYRFFF